MGKDILPLVNYILLDEDNFTAVFLCKRHCNVSKFMQLNMNQITDNALESDTRYRVDPEDVLNFLVLQRQQNLIVEINKDRKW